jgi:hypothetical protein
MTWLLRFLLLMAAVTATRWPLAPQHLFFFDSINFALALEEFNPALHQPQPPGYPMFVALGRLLLLVTPGVESAFLAAGIVGAAAAVWFLWRLAGGTAALLLLFHPVLIFGGITNQVRVFYALIGCGTAWFAWKAWPREAPAAAILSLAAFLGFGAGFRPDTAFLMLPLFLAVLWRNRSRRALIAGAAALYGAGVASWLTPAVVASGGVSGYIGLIRTYSRDQFTTSLFFDASLPVAAKMAAAAVIWPGLGVLTWIWFVPFAHARMIRERLAPLAPILLLWFVPALLFFALVHVADPDQSLLLAPIYCIAGGAVIDSALARPAWMCYRAAACVLLAGANVFLFFNPPKGIPEAAGYGVVKYINRQSQAVFSALEKLAAQGSLQVLVYQPPLTWRKIAYYTRPSPVYVVEDSATVWSARGKHREEISRTGGDYAVAAKGNVAIILPPAQDALRRDLIRSSGFRELGPVLWRPADAGVRFQVAKAVFTIVP